MEKYWSGQAFLLWKDPLKPPGQGISGGQAESPSKILQDLLREAGVYRKPLTASINSDTLSAVERVSVREGIEKDGIVGVKP